MATATRVLQQIRHDHRTLALMLIVPCVLLGLLAWIYQNTPVFDSIGAPLLGIFPFLIDVPGHQHRDPAGAAVRHPGTAADHAAGQG